MATGKLNIETSRIPTIAEHVCTLVAAAPPLTDEQIANIRYFLTHGTVSAVAA